MDIHDVQRTWDTFGKTDPLWAVLTCSDKMGNRWDPEAFFATGVQDVDAVMHDLDALGVTPDRERALDFGCAVGRLTQSLAPRFDETIGIDIAPSMLELAERFNRFGDTCRYLHNGEDNLALFPSEHFTFVLSLITLQHVEPRYARQYLQEFLRVLKPGGVLVFQLPSHETPSYRLKKALKGFVPSSVLYQYRRMRHGEVHAQDPTRNRGMEMYGIPKPEVVALLEQAGGSVVDTQPDDHAGNWTSYRYVVVKPRPADS